MTRLNWDTLGERFYETGVDHGVLYINRQGFAWSGLTSVAETSSGGEPKPHYIDGYKYANFASAEEFEATIQALSSPPEFAGCDGMVAVQAGLFATRQPRKPFGFSYRTNIGNDVEGVSHGYKIHLVYNALASPSARTNNTINETAVPGALSWSITAFPPRVTGFKPTAHFIIDTRFTPEDILAIIEDLLYGSDEYTAQQPTVTELLEIFNGELILDSDSSAMGPVEVLDGGAP